MGFNDTFSCTMLYCFRIGTLSEKQSDCTQNNTFSCSGFACYYGESRMENNI